MNIADKKNLLLLLLAILLSGCAGRIPPAKKCGGIMPDGGQAYALLIGIDQYDTEKLTNLRFPKFEVNKLAEILRAQGYKTRVISDFAATRKGVLDSLQWLTEGRDEKDRLLVYFAGHGMNFRMLQRYKSNLCPATSYSYSTELGAINTELNAAAKTSSDTSLDYLILALRQQQKEFCDVIGAHEIVKELNGSRAHQKIIIIDACYSGVITEFSYFAIPVYSPRIIEDGLIGITGAKEITMDGKHSPFLFAGLRGAADTTWAGNRDGCVSAYELAVFMDGVLRYKYGLAQGAVYKIRYVHIGTGDIQLVDYRKK
jgi:hypothetical protein